MNRSQPHHHPPTPRRTAWRILPVVAALLLVLTGCDRFGDDDAGTATPPAEFADAPLAPGALVWALSSPPSTLDPARAAVDPSALQVATQVYDRLFRFRNDGSFELAPGVAADWDVDLGGKTYTFTIREGLRFHDGSPLDAPAVKWNFDRWMDPEHEGHDGDFLAWRSMFGGFVGQTDEATDRPLNLVERVQALDRTTLRITLREPFAPFPYHLALVPFGLASPRAVAAQGADYGADPDHLPVGSGPFRVVRWDEPSGTVTLLPFAEHWPEPARAPGLRFVTIEDVDARWAAVVDPADHISASPLGRSMPTDGEAGALAETTGGPPTDTPETDGRTGPLTPSAVSSATVDVDADGQAEGEGEGETDDVGRATEDAPPGTSSPSSPEPIAAPEQTSTTISDADAGGAEAAGEGEPQEQADVEGTGDGPTVGVTGEVEPSGDVRPEARVVAVHAAEFPPDSWHLPTSDEESRRVNVVPRPPRSTAWLMLNHSRPPLGDPRVRRAISLAIDRRALARGEFGPYALPAGQMLPPGFPGHDPSLTPNESDLAAARSLLEEAGTTENFRLNIWVPATSRPYLPDPERVGEAVAAMIRPLGIETDVRAESMRRFLTGRDNGRFTAWIMGWEAQSPDPDNVWYWHFSPARVPYEGQYENSDLSDLLLDAQRMISSDERDTLYRTAAQIVHADTPRVFLAHARPRVVVRRTVRGYVPGPMGTDQLAVVDLAAIDTANDTADGTPPIGEPSPAASRQAPTSTATRTATATSEADSTAESEGTDDPGTDGG